MVESIVSIGISVTIFLVISLLVISLSSIALQNKKLKVKAAQAELDRLTVYVQAEKIFKEESERAKQSDDGFIKFMSKSRDWAFEYIEQVQMDLYNLKELFDEIGVAPKTVAQANDLHERIRVVLKNLPDDEEKE